MAEHGERTYTSYIGADEGPSKTCQHSDGCRSPAFKRSYCKAHYDVVYRPTPKLEGDGKRREATNTFYGRRVN